jgi:hypothetical protein
MIENRRSDAHTRPRRSGARIAFVFAAMLAVFLQAFAVQTHIHALAAPVIAAGHEQAADSSATPDGAHATVADHQTICVICQALAANGNATLADAAQLAALTASSNETAALAIRRAPRALTHSWQSRAPPIAA